MNTNWKYDPSGLKRGDLNAWRNRMFQACPNPHQGQIVVVLDLEEKQVGYKCVVPKGYDTRWARVSRDTMVAHLADQTVQEYKHHPVVKRSRPMEVQAANYNGSAHADPTMGVYLGGGVYISPDECWF